ncbi:MAG: VWA domain-containing protein, partial [Candidatus Rokuibacteriota bacterium]
QLPSLRDLTERVRQRRQRELDRYDLGSALDDIRQKLDTIVKTEREGIERRLADAQERARRGEIPESTQQQFGEMAAQRRQSLDQLPPDPAGRIMQLQRYEFMDPEAWRLFQELMQSLRQQMLKPFLQGMQQALQGMGPQDLKRLREMLKDLNQMLQDRAEGREPNFQEFKNKWGDSFPGVENLDQLLEQIGRQMGQMQSLLESMSPEQRRELQEMMRSLLGQDERLERELARLAANLEEMLPMDQLRRGYDFRGEDPVTLQEAMRLMEELQRLDELERQLRGVKSVDDIEKLDRQAFERLLGPEASRELEDLQGVTKQLEEAGYIERDGDELKLTAKAIRRIGDKALRDIFAHLKRDRFGGHAIHRRGAGGDQADETKTYEFGDPFLLDLKETVMNAVERGGVGTPIGLAPDDFEVFRTELRTQSATVVMLDLSRSMLNNGYFLPAKKVAMALSALIRGQFPRDSLHVVGFSMYAHEVKASQVPRLSWSDCDYGTNMHAGFLLSRRLLARRPGGNKQILMITDGEPTAHLMRNGQADFNYPPTRETMQQTLREVQRCTREGIIINTFMLERSPWLTAFVEEMARINRGRAFFSTPDRLGEYMLVDFVRSRRTRVS